MLSLRRLQPIPDETFEAGAVTERTRVRALVASRGGVPHGDDFKQRALWGDHKHQFSKPAKCGYCESRKRLKAELHVDHFRPKAAVTELPLDWKDLPIDTPKRVHERVVPGHGYWWLAYTWSNYLLACHSCNSTFKSNLFPVEGARARCVEGGEIGEMPILLNPYEDFETRKHFSWDAVGYIHPESDRARATILVCGLNCEDLVVERRDFLNRVFCPIAESYSPLDRGSVAAERLREIGDTAAEFAGLVRWWFEWRYRGRLLWNTAFPESKSLSP